MRNLCCFVLLLFCAARGYARSNSYLFVWAGGDAKKSGVSGDIPKNTAENRTEEELKGLENEVLQAMLHADMPALDRIFSDDWIIVDEDAQVRDKKAEFEPYKTGEEKVTAGRLDDMRVRLFGESAAVTGRYMFKGSFQGKQFDIKGRFTDVWVRRNGRWQIVSSQNTAIPEANATEFPPDSFFIAMEKEVWEALKHKDKVAATRLLADDFVGMYDTGYSSKSEWVKQIDDQYTVDDYTIENVKLLRPKRDHSFAALHLQLQGDWRMGGVLLPRITHFRSLGQA